VAGAGKDAQIEISSSMKGRKRSVVVSKKHSSPPPQHWTPEPRVAPARSNTRALLLAALDRKEDAQQSLQKVFLFPDRNLSHALAREARRVLRD
jgi:hypothetical protein